MGGEGEGLLGGGVVSPMKRRPELAVGWAVGSVVSAKLSCLALSISGERERDRERETVCASLTGQTCIVTHVSIERPESACRTAIQLTCARHAGKIHEHLDHETKCSVCLCA